MQLNLTVMTTTSTLHGVEGADLGHDVSDGIECPGVTSCIKGSRLSHSGPYGCYA